MNYFEELEIADYDSELLNVGDYESVLKLRKIQLEKYPRDYLTKYRWADILVITKKYNEALLVLSELHNEDPLYDDVNCLILDCLRLTNSKASDFKWKFEIKVYYLDDELMDSILKYLKGKRKENRTISSLHSHLSSQHDYLFFDENELFKYLSDSNRVIVHGHDSYSAWVEKVK